MKRTRIILADDHTLLLDAIKNLLEPEFAVIATFTDGHALVEEHLSQQQTMRALLGLDPGLKLRLPEDAVSALCH